MFKIGKWYSFEAAHQLPGHEGKCANLHGHSYQALVWLKGTLKHIDASDRDMVLDYSDLDKVVKPLIDAMDHSFLVSGFRGEVVVEGKLYQLMMRSTAENIAAHIAHRVALGLNTHYNIHLLGVEVRETAKSFAEYIMEVHPQ